MTVDFHVHSTASDGTFTPGEITDMAVRGGFAAIALTDHDNCDGAGGDWPGVRGIELSIDPGDGFDKFHLLGLGINPENCELKAFLGRILAGRNERNERIFANFRRLGIDIRPEPHGEVLARPHFAKWLVLNGYADDIPDAFAKYLLADSPAQTSCYEERYHPSQEEAFGIVHGAGGICVMAHPKYWRNSWKRSAPDYAAVERELARLREKGLDGIEALYQANTAEENAAFIAIGSRLGMLMTAGSDFHGDNKKHITLGMTVDEPFIRPVLERLAIVA